MDKMKLRKCREVIYWARVVSRAVDHPIPFTYNPYEKDEEEGTDYEASTDFSDNNKRG